MNTNINAVEVAQAIQPYVVEVRREFHQIPETRYETDKTRYLIRHRLIEMGFQERQVGEGFVGKTRFREYPGGIVLDIHYAGSTDRILFRADFDALPVREATGLPFTSKTEGNMHACGHDVHTAMLLGFLKCVADGLIQPKHNLRIVFQDAEENPGTPPEPISGGEMLVKDGVCDGVSSAYALHIWNNPSCQTGVFYSRPGGMMGNSGRMKFVIRSSGGHVMNPAGGVNALRVVQAVQNRLDTFLARNFQPTEPATLEPVICNSGKGSNVMPAEAELWFGFRTLLPRDEHIAMSKKVEAEVKVVVEGLGAELAEAKLIYGHPALINHEIAYAKSKSLLDRTGLPSEVVTQQLGGEDFAHYLYKVPGAMWFLGAHTPSSGGDHHSPTFNPDESVLPNGVLFWILLATN